jgi:FAD/FMN-containing dehydrogenase
MTSFLTVSGSKVTLDEDKTTAFKGTLRGPVYLSSSEGYDASREIWNKMIDRKPAAIAQCTGQADVIACVKFALENDLNVSIRGAGHNIAGKSLANDCLCIDLSHWRSVYVNSASKTLMATPGATLGDIDHETKEHGLALPMGINSTTGISGLTLGGGYGW